MTVGDLRLWIGGLILLVIGPALAFAVVRGVLIGAAKMDRAFELKLSSRIAFILGAGPAFVVFALFKAPSEAQLSTVLAHSLGSMLAAYFHYGALALCVAIFGIWIRHESKEPVPASIHFGVILALCSFYYWGIPYLAKTF